MQQLPSVLESDRDSARVETDVGLYYIFVEEVLQRGAVAAADRFLAADFLAHGMAGDLDRCAFIAHLAARRARFPDAAWTIEALAGVGGLVVCYMTMTTPESADRGWESLVIRFENDKIVEYWSICDRVLLQS